MRLLKPLLMTVIGMIAVTAFASTPMPEKNQKVTIEKNQVSFYVVADVLPFQVLTVNAEGTVFTSYAFEAYRIKNYEPIKQFAVIVDVGWCESSERYKQIGYHERLNRPCLFDHEKNLKKLGVTITHKLC